MREIYPGAWQQVRVVAAATITQVDAAGLRRARSLRPVYGVTHTHTDTNKQPSERRTQTDPKHTREAD